MLRAKHIVMTTAAAWILALSPCAAQDFKGFSPADICTGPDGSGPIKFPELLQASIASSGCRVIDKDGNVASRNDLITCAAANSDSLKAFLKHHPKSRFTLSLRKDPDKPVTNAKDFLTNFQNYQADCVAAGNANGFEKASNDINTGAAEIGKFFTVRKAPSDLAKPLDVADPAFVSFSDDKIARNKAASYAVTVGTEFKFGSDDIGSSDPFAATYGTIFPYVSFAGEQNSLNSKADLENWSAGVRMDYLNFPIAGEFLKTDIGGFVEYLTDSEADSEVISSETGIRPRFRNTIPLLNMINRKTISYGYYGPWIYPELTGKLRYGHVFDAGGKPGLLLTNDYMRSGFTVGAKTGYAGSGPMSGLELSASYSMFDT